MQAPNPAAAAAAPLTDAEINDLQQLLNAVPPPLEALDIMALDGFLCGVLLQPRPVPLADWMARITDLDGRALPPSFDAQPLHTLVRRRHAELAQAIAQRDWFDPWIYPLDEAASPADTVLPWVAGFAAAMDLFPGLMAIDDPELIEPLALLYMHFEPDDLEDADALKAVIETLEPPTDLGEAVQDLVRSLMLIADVSRPRPVQPAVRPRPGGKRRR